MEIKRTKTGWTMLDKVQNDLDRFVNDCVAIIKKHLHYVLVSGYVVIVLGRSRATEDIDMLIEPVDKARFNKFYNEALRSGFEFLNPEDANGLYEMLEERTAIRMSRKDRFIPNLEIKYFRDAVGKETLEHREILRMGPHKLYISPLEIQIPYKLSLGSPKDIEDAVYLWELLKQKLDVKRLRRYMVMLGIRGNAHGIG